MQRCLQYQIETTLGVSSFIAILTVPRPAWCVAPAPPHICLVKQQTLPQTSARPFGASPGVECGTPGPLSSPSHNDYRPRRPYRKPAKGGVHPIRHCSNGISNYLIGSHLLSPLWDDPETSGHPWKVGAPSKIGRSGPGETEWWSWSGHGSLRLAKCGRRTGGLLDTDRDARPSGHTGATPRRPGGDPTWRYRSPIDTPTSQLARHALYLRSGAIPK